MTERILTWDGCLNVRDLGGHPTEDGRFTRFGAVVRADSVRRLTDTGWAALVDYGIRRIVDLRRHDELAEDHPRELPVEVVHVPLSTEEEEVELRLAWRTRGIRDAYVFMIERLAPSFARAVEAVAGAPEGGVVVHCYAGKDRTGLACAMLLRLAGVGVDDIAADYGVSRENLRPLLDPWVAEAEDDEERALRVQIGASPPEVMSDVLTQVEQRHGTIREYLLAAGTGEAALDDARRRLLG